MLDPEIYNAKFLTYELLYIKNSNKENYVFYILVRRTAVRGVLKFCKINIFLIYDRGYLHKKNIFKVNGRNSAWWWMCLKINLKLPENH